MISGTGRDPNTKPLEMLECFVCAAQAIAYGPFDNLKLCQENNYICLAKEENNTLCRFVVGDTTWAYCCLFPSSNDSYFLYNMLIVLVFA